MPRKRGTEAIIIGFGLLGAMILLKSCVVENLVYKSSNITIKNEHKESADSASINFKRNIK